MGRAFKLGSQYFALSCDATRCGTALSLRRFMYTKSRPQRTASCRAASRREDRTDFYPMRPDAIRRSNRVLLTSGTYPYLHFTWPVMRAIKISQRKRFEEKLVEAMRSCPCRGREFRSATSAFLTKGYVTPLVDAVCEILHAPKRFFSEVYPSTP